MTPDEKDRLLGLFEQEDRWCKHVEAQDKRGKPVRYRDAAAVSWDLVGGMCFLFGWERACVLFKEVGRCVGGVQYVRESRDLDIAAMAFLQDFNDKRDTTYDLIMATLRKVRVYRRGGAPLAASGGQSLTDS